MRSVILLLLISCTMFSSANGRSVLDSLYQELDKANTDSCRISLYLETANTETDTAKAYRLIDKAIVLAKQSDNKRALAQAYTIHGIIEFDVSEFSAAAYWYTAALREWTAIGDRNRMAFCYLELGLLDLQFGNGDHSISNVHRSIALSAQLKDTVALRHEYNELANCFHHTHQYDSSLYYLRRSSCFYEKGNHSLASLYHGMAKAFLNMKKLDSATVYVDRSDSVFGVIGENFGVYWNKLIRADLFAHQGKTSEAQAMLEDVYRFSLEKQDGQMLFNVVPALLKCYHLTNEFRKGFLLQAKWDSLQDSLLNSEMANRSLGIQLRLEEEQRSAIDSLEKKQNEEMHRARESRQLVITWSVVAGLALITILALIIYRGYRIKQRSNIEISEQKKKIEEKQKEIIDSIHYAKRIQQSLLPTERYIDKHLKPD